MRFSSLILIVLLFALITSCSPAQPDPPPLPDGPALLMFYTDG